MTLSPYPKLEFRLPQRVALDRTCMRVSGLHCQGLDCLAVRMQAKA